MVDLYYFLGLIFVDVYTYLHCALYNRTYYVGLIFVLRQSSAKTAKIGPLENFPLYGTYMYMYYAITVDLFNKTLSLPSHLTPRMT